MGEAVTTNFTTTTLAFTNYISTSTGSSGLIAICCICVNSRCVKAISSGGIVRSVTSGGVDRTRNSRGKLELTLTARLSFVPRRIFRSDSRIGRLRTIGNLGSGVRMRTRTTTLIVNNGRITCIRGSRRTGTTLRGVGASCMSRGSLGTLRREGRSTGAPLPRLGRGRAHLLSIHFARSMSVSRAAIGPSRVVDASRTIGLLRGKALRRGGCRIGRNSTLAGVTDTRGLSVGRLIRLGDKLGRSSLVGTKRRLGIAICGPCMGIVTSGRIFGGRGVSCRRRIVRSDDVPGNRAGMGRRNGRNMHTTACLVSRRGNRAIGGRMGRRGILRSPIGRVIVGKAGIVPSHNRNDLTCPTIKNCVSDGVKCH